MTMFSYDAQIAAAVSLAPQSIADVLGTMRTIDGLCDPGDGLKWFNSLYLQVTQAVEDKVNTGGFADPAWLALLDVEFAKLYFAALQGFLVNGRCSGCWYAMFSVRSDARIARIQFALAGVNAHINHDLPAALVATCDASNIAPQHGTAQYTDYTNLNATLDGLIETAKKELNVRLLGDPLPPVSHLEDAIAAWGTSQAREQAWNHSEALWYLRDVPAIATGYLRSLDGLTTFGNRILLAPVP
jgi:Family of unknown function (DUF5995)